MHGCSDDVLLSILEANKKATEVIENSSKLLLHEVINRNLSSCFLLQQVIQAKCSSKLILAVLQANTDAEKCQVSLKGSILPLIYHASEQGCSDDVLLALLNANNSAAKIKYRFGFSLLQRVIVYRYKSRP